MRKSQNGDQLSMLFFAMDGENLKKKESIG